MKISAVIPTKNRPKDLVYAIESILEQSRQPDQLIVVDQSASDESKMIILSLFSEATTNMELVYVLDSSISGLIAAKKYAVNVCTSDIICYLEDDVVLETDYILEIEHGFIRIAGMYGCCGVVTEVEKVSQLYVAVFQLFHRGIFFDPRVGVHGVSGRPASEMIQSSYLSGGLSAYRMEVFDGVDFDTVNGFFMLEDIEFSTRAAGHFGAERFYINTSARLAHNMSPMNRANLGQRWEQKSREYVMFYKKHKCRVADFLSLSWLFVGLSVEAVWQSAVNRSTAPIPGLLAGWVAGLKTQLK